MSVIIKVFKELCPPIILDSIRWFYNRKNDRIQTEHIDNGAIRLSVKSFGNKNPEKYFYVITGFSAGMFSTLQYGIAHIRRAEMFGMIPVVDFKNFKSAYTSSNPVAGELNTWNWFFENISDYSIDEVYKSRNVFFGAGYDWSMGYYFSSHNFFEIYSKHIFLKEIIKAKINNYKEKLGFDGKRILGVQFRGWEMNTAPGHPFCPTIKQMFKYTDEILKKYNIDKIYLATEQQEYHDAFIKKYCDKILFTPYFMTKKGVNAYKIQPEPRENHLYQCGVEIIINAFLLSECIGLLHCGTNVSTFAKFINNGKYEFEYFIFNGVNSNNPLLARYMYSIRKILPKSIGGLKNEVTIKLQGEK